jgi:PhoPQ-activated pathogenicity-related protein
MGVLVVSVPRWPLAMIRLGLTVLVVGLVLAGDATVARAGLDEYIKKPDSAFSWTQTGGQATPAGTITFIKLTSQVWQGITWKHDFRIYEPVQLVYPDAMLLFITGGGHNSKVSDNDHKQAFALAQLCGARVAVLPQVPNQPLLDDKTEDTLIAETFVRYLKSNDENWPLLFPMVKSAVRAMDALQAWAKENRKPAVTRFVVTGGSKRGWTTWLTGAVDDRVVAIAPMVIVILKLDEQGPNQLKVWGKYSEQIDDYVQRGLMEVNQTPEGKRLWKMVDPFTFRDRLTMPKMLINGTNDRYWTLNALDLYWNELKGPKYLVELPNAGHGLEVNRDWALGGVGAFFRHVISGRSMPEISWDLTRADAGDSTLTIHASVAPLAARIWTAHSDNRDFRESRWVSSPLKPGETITTRVPAVPKGHVVVLGEVEYKIDDIPYHLTTTFLEPTAGSPQGAPK